VVLLLAAPPVARADDWPLGDYATGRWGGFRTEAEDRGLALAINYTAEAFVRDAEKAAYRGNLDMLLQLDTEKAHLWPGGTVLVYGQDGHGSGVSDGAGFLMPVSNYEAPEFTQLSELWLYQELPYGFSMRLGKQDANRDFAAPRFGGNFANSSFGVLPTSPLPSYPAPALGAAAFVAPTSWFDVRGGIYEGEPALESFGNHAFDGDATMFAIGAGNLHVGQGGLDTIVQAGGWHLTGDDRSGGFAIADVLLPEDLATRHRTVQAFGRANWEPNAAAPDAQLYLGGGLTAHGFLGTQNTLGIGAGFVKVTNDSQGFVELLFKWRPVKWFTVEPDLQLYFLGGDAHVITGLRCRLKL
jgi:porin